MSGLVDMPCLEQIAWRHRRRRGFFVAMMALLLSSLLWAAPEDQDGLSLKINWSGALEGDGMPGLFPGQEVGYQVVVENHGNATVDKVFVQASLHSDGVACRSLTLNSGALIPGAPFSPFRTVSLSPGQSHVVDHAFRPPDGLCPSTGKLRVRVQYEVKGDVRSFLTDQPIRFVVP
jgi:hypothetical protein